jgi:hypothetical protein
MALLFLATQARVLSAGPLSAAVVEVPVDALTRACILLICSSVAPWGVGGGPELSVTATVAPGWASKPGGASWERTRPSGTNSLCCCPVTFVRRPRPESAALASSKAIPERSGTDTNFETGSGLWSGLGAGAGAEACALAEICCPTCSSWFCACP